MTGMTDEGIVLIGGGGHALSVADSIKSAGKYKIIGYTARHNENNKLKYLGTDDVLKTISNRGVKLAAICVGYLGDHELRDRLYNMAKSFSLQLPPILDPTAVISETAAIGEGSFVGKNAVLNASSVVGKMCIINTGTIIEHKCSIGDFSHIAVGAVLCGDVAIGNHVLIGANATVLQGVEVGMNCIIGAGSIVLANVPENTRVLGLWGGTLEVKK